MKDAWPKTYGSAGEYRRVLDWQFGYKEWQRHYGKWHDAFLIDHGYFLSYMDQTLREI